MLSRFPRLLAATVVVGVLLAACSGQDAEDAAVGNDGRPASVTGFEVGQGGSPTDDAAVEGDAVEPDGPAAEPQEQTEDAEEADEQDPAPGGGLPDVTPTPGDRVIKEGTVTAEVESFDGAFRAVVAMARRLGGTVVASTSKTDDHGTSGSVTVRVPVDDYEDLLTDLDDVGTIVERDITAQDVTTEYTDLESRLRHLRAQERFYLELLEDAESIADAVTVRQQLDALQADIEQVRGRIQLLDARTTYSTLTVELYEPGAPLLATTPGPRPTLAEYWERARDAFTNVVGVMLVSVFFLAPLTIPAALVFAAWRSLRARPAPVVAEAD